MVSDLVVFGSSPCQNTSSTNSEVPANNTDNLDTNESDVDSAVGIPRRTSTASIDPEAYFYTEVHNRTFARYFDTKYLLPNDEREQERLDLQHHAFGLLLQGELNLVHPSSIQRVLDAGTGTGIWAIDYADKHPEADVIGIDISPIQPVFVPPNCSFQIEDLSQPWDFSQKFNFIHGRMLFCCFADPLNLFRNAFNALTSGGVLEIQDVIFEFQSINQSLEGTSLEKWTKTLTKSFEFQGLDLNCVSRYKEYFESIGFEDIQQKELEVPVGNWGNCPQLKELGEYWRVNIYDMLHAISIRPLTECGPPHSMSVEAVEVLLTKVRKDLRNPSIYAYQKVIIINGRKGKPNGELE